MTRRFGVSGAVALAVAVLSMLPSLSVADCEQRVTQALGQLDLPPEQGRGVLMQLCSQAYAEGREQAIADGVAHPASPPKENPKVLGVELKPADADSKGHDRLKR